MKARRIHTQQKLASQNRLAWVKGAAAKQWDEPAFHCYLLQMGIQKAVGCVVGRVNSINGTTNSLIA